MARRNDRAIVLLQPARFAERQGGKVLVQQAIFTSVRSGRNAGYQIAACSPGVSHQQSRELAKWGPSHDSLYDLLPSAESVNYHLLSGGLHCVSQTVLAGREYSGRGGQRVYTQMFLVPDALFARFGNSPFRVIESLVVSGRFSVPQELPTQLAPLVLVGRASTVNTANLEHVVRKMGPQKLASLVTAALNTERLGISSRVSGKRLLHALLDLMPPDIRPSFALTTGLKVSGVRDYRLAILPANTEEHRRAIRQVRLEVLDLTGDPPTKFAPNKGWPQLVHQLLRARQYKALAEIVESTRPGTGCDLDLIAEQQRERLDKEAEDPSLTPFPA